MRGRRSLLLLAAVLIGGLVLAELLTSGHGDEEPQAPPLPAAVLVPPKATIESLRGKPAVVNFWASWCEPCREEAAHLQRFHESHRGRVGVVGVSYTDELKGARRFIRQYGWTFPNLSDPEGLAGSRYSLAGLPVTVILDSEGRIAARLRGPQTEATLDRAVREAESS
ncbi:MAG TPA: TlpA disulfide reductase family protein [Thermoleophilaceae bacterium]|jgi:thiol-disulfide isomerase/thioredoxin